MRWIWVLAFSLLHINASYNEPISKDKIRETYVKALGNAKFINDLKALTTPRNSAFQRAFYASALALEARESSWVPNKVSFAKKAYEELNLAVAKDSQDLEIRFLRFSFSCEVPDMLKLNAHLTEDKKIIVNQLKSPQALAPTMIGYFQKSSCLSATEKKALISKLQP
jgi:hypothetical protein